MNVFKLRQVPFLIAASIVTLPQTQAISFSIGADETEYKDKIVIGDRDSFAYNIGNNPYFYKDKETGQSYFIDQKTKEVTNMIVNGYKWIGEDWPDEYLDKADYIQNVQNGEYRVNLFDQSVLALEVDENDEEVLHYYITNNGSSVD